MIQSNKEKKDFLGKSLEIGFKKKSPGKRKLVVSGLVLGLGLQLKLVLKRNLQGKGS